MKGLITVIGMIVFILICGLTGGDVIHVDDDNTAGPWDGSEEHPYRTIQDAVNNAEDGDRIIVHEGNYTESVSVNVQISIEGTSVNDVIVIAGPNGYCMQIQSDGVRVTNMTFRNATSEVDASVQVLSDLNILENLNVSDNAIHGIMLYSATDVQVINIIAQNNDGYGIRITSNSNNVMIQGLVVQDGSSGIDIYQSSEISVSEVEFRNLSDVAIHGDNAEAFVTNCTIYNVSGDHFYLVSSSMSALNCTFNRSDVIVVSYSHLYVLNYLHVRTVQEGIPVEGVDVKVTDDNLTVYASQGYGGSSPRTDGEGYVRWIPLGYMDISDTETRYNDTRVYVKMNGWNDTRRVNMSNSHTEVFLLKGRHTFYVFASNAGDPAMNGSKEHPYDTIEKALFNASSWDLIRIWAGEYNESLPVNMTITISGNGSTTVITSADTAFDITGPNVILSNLIIRNATIGVISNKTLTVRDVTFDRTDVGIRGLRDASIYLDRCEFDTCGIGVLADNATVYVTNSTFHASGGSEGFRYGLKAQNITLYGVNYTITSAETGMYMRDGQATLYEVSIVNNRVGLEAVDSSVLMEYASLYFNLLTQIRLENAKAIITNSTLKRAGNYTAILQQSNMSLINCILDSSGLQLDNRSIVSVFNFLHIYVNNTDGSPIKGADALVTGNDAVYYSSQGFNGSGRRTDSEGMIRWILAPYRFIYSSSEVYPDVNVTVRYAPTEELAWNETRIVNMSISHTENFTYVPPPVNRMPWTEVDTPAGEVNEDVTINFTLYDKEGDNCTVAVQYSTDGVNYFNATIRGDDDNVIGPLTSSPEGIVHSFVWASYSDLPDVDDRTVWIRLTSMDAHQGYTNATAPFHLDNDLNPPEIKIDPMKEDEYSGDIFVYFNLSDRENATCSVYVEFSVGEGYMTARMGPGTNTSSSMSSSQDGVPYLFVWDSESDLMGLDVDNVTLRIIANDGGADDDNGTPAYVILHVDNNKRPQVTITPKSEEQSGEVEIRFRLKDQEGDNCTIRVDYSLNGRDFQPADVNASETSLFGSSRSGRTHRIIWNSTQLGEVEYEYVIIRITPYDNDRGKNGTAVFHVDNDFEAPWITDAKRVMSVLDTLRVWFSIADNQSAISSVSVYYQISGQQMRPASISSESESIVGNKITGLNTSTSGIIHTFLWDSLADLSKSHHDEVYLILIPSDGNEMGDRGSEYAVGPFEVNNHLHLPRAEIITPSGVQTGNVNITYTLYDVDNETSDVLVHYSTDGGETWKKASQGGGDGTNDLLATADGMTYEFIWDSAKDLPNTTEDKVRIRIKVSNDHEIGDTVMTDNFTVNNVLNLRPELKILSSSPDYGDIIITFLLRDDDSLMANVTLYYYIGKSNTANVTGMTKNLTSGSGSQHTIIWHSVSDLGYVSIQHLKLIFRVNDGIDSNSTVYFVDLQNNQMPVVEFDFYQDLGDGNVTIRYILTDEQEDYCDLDVEYSLDKKTFNNASVNLDLGEPITGVMSSSSGEYHTLVWSALQDVGPVDIEAVIRIRAYDGNYYSLWEISRPIEIRYGWLADLPPKIEHYPPVSAEAESPLTLHFNVTDESSSLNVTFQYRVKGENQYRSLSVNKVSTRQLDGRVKTLFTVTIPPEDVIPPGVEYYITADDGMNDPVTSPRNISNPHYVAVSEPPVQHPVEEEKREGMVTLIVIIPLVAMGVMGAVVGVLWKKGKIGRKGGSGGKPPMTMAPAQPQIPQSGQTVNCPVCGSPIFVPPQRPITVMCSSCRNSFVVK